MNESIFDIFSKQLYSNHETLVRILVYEIRLRNPKAVKFIVNTSTVKSILLHLKTQKFDVLMYLYGHPFVIELLKILEEYEEYEMCAEIKRQIEEHNALVKDCLPTR